MLEKLLSEFKKNVDYKDYRDLTDILSQYIKDTYLVMRKIDFDYEQHCYDIDRLLNFIDDELIFCENKIKQFLDNKDSSKNYKYIKIIYQSYSNLKRAKDNLQWLVRKYKK